MELCGESWSRPEVLLWEFLQSEFLEVGEEEEGAYPVKEILLLQLPESKMMGGHFGVYLRQRLRSVGLHLHNSFLSLTGSWLALDPLARIPPRCNEGWCPLESA